MSIFSSLINGISSGTAHKLASEGVFSSNGLKNIKVSDENTTREEDADVVKVLSDNKYSSESIKRRNEIFEQDSIIKSATFNTLDSLGRITRNLKDLSSLYDQSLNPEEKKAYETEITALTEEFNSLIKSDTFKRAGEITSSLASSLANKKNSSSGSAGLRKSLDDNLSIIGANYLNQATRSNTTYFKNLEQSLQSLQSISLSAEFKDGKVLLSAGEGSGIVSTENSVVLDKVLERTDSALSAFLKGSSLEGILDKSIEGFRKLDKISEKDKNDPIDLAQGIRTQVLKDPEKGLAAQAFLSPLIALNTLF